VQQCPTCKHIITGTERFCPVCGQALAVVAWQPAPAVETTIPVMPAQNSRLAIASLVCGIVAWILFFVPLLLAVPAIICGHLGHGAVKRSNGAISGGGLALTGLILGYAHLALTGVALCIGALILALTV